MIIIFRFKLIRWQFIGRLRGREDTSSAAALLFNWVVTIVVKHFILKSLSEKGEAQQTFANLVEPVSDGILYLAYTYTHTILCW